MAATQEAPERQADVLVVGAGCCGLIAAIRATQGGAKVVLAEKLDRFAGDTTLSTGTIPAAGTRLQAEAGIADSVDGMVADIERITGPQDTSHLIPVFAGRSAEVVHWLIDRCAIRFKLYTTYKHIGHQVARLHLQPSGKGLDLVEQLAAAARRAGLDIEFSTPVRELLSDAEGRVCGAVLEGPRGRERVQTRKVILASGGFGGNAALLREYCPDIAEAPFFGAPGSQGDALLWGRALGAQLGNIAAYQPHGSVAFPQLHLLTWSAAEMGAFYVNRQGERFANENRGYSAFGSISRRYGNEVYAIYDARIRDYIGEHLATYKNLVGMGGAQTADSIEALAALHGIDAAGLAATFEAYQRCARGEAQDPLGRSDFGMAPLQAPFVVTRVQACLFHTQGGLMVDERARVLRPDGTPIPNLFAGGGAAACISGRAGGAGYVSGNGLLTASVLGYLAAQTALAELGRSV